MNRKKVKILWRHPNFREYRVPLFDSLNSEYEIRFLLTRASEWDEKYNHVIFCSNDDKSIWFDFQSLKTFLNELITENYEILISSFSTSSATFIATLVAKLRRKKVIIWEENWIRKTGARHKLGYLLLRYFYFLLVDAFFACGQCQKEYLESFGVKEKKIFIANESSPDISQVSRREIDLGVDIKNKKIVLFIGRIIDWKGLDSLIKSFSYIEKTNKDIFLLIAGDGDYKSKCVQLAKELNLTNYKFLGQINDLGVKSFLFQIANVVVVPSIVTSNGFEGGPIVVPEALSAATPIVASDAIGSTLQLINTGSNGFVFKREDSKELAEKILLVLNNPKYESMCKAARSVYESRCNYNQLKNVFSECVNSIMNNGAS